MTNVNALLRDHVSLKVECLDRIYLDGYIPTLQVPGQLVRFLLDHRGNKIPSPALLVVLPSHLLIASRPSPRGGKAYSWETEASARRLSALRLSCLSSATAGRDSPKP